MLLAVDTALEHGSVALIDSSGALIRSRDIEGHRQHARLLATTAQSVLGEDLSSVSHYALTIGPGSFTGLRIGLAFIKGLAVAHPRPVFPVSTFDAIVDAVSSTHPHAERCLVVVDVRANEAYAQLFVRGSAGLEPSSELPPAMYAVDALRAKASPAEGLVVAGEGAASLGLDPSIPTAPQARSSALAVARLAHARRARGEAGVDALDLEPLYLARSAAEEKKAKKSLGPA